MPAADPLPWVPLSEDERAILRVGLTLYSDLDEVELSGFLHALALAPQSAAASTWLPEVLTADPKHMHPERAETLVSLVQRLYQEIQHGVDNATFSLPDAADPDDLRAFAQGYMRWATHDATWFERPEYWRLALPLAYLAGEYELIPEEALLALEREPQVDVRLRRELPALLQTTQLTFASQRGDQ